MEQLIKLLPHGTQWNIPRQQLVRQFSPVVEPMSRTEQNPVYHGEGTVWAHTKAVCEALVKLPEFEKLSEQKQQVLFLAALLHDVGKISTTRKEDGKWVSPNHAPVGARMARQLLWLEWGLCGTQKAQQLRETVCNLIRYHSIPAHVIDDPDGKRKLLSIAANGALCPMFDLELLCLLAQADALGRICGDQNRMLEQVGLCRELARESDCLNGPFAFSSDHARQGYLSGRTAQPQVELFDDTWGPVILLSGLPGTGKDTFIRQHYPELPVVSLDQLRQQLGVSPTDKQSPVLEAAREQARTFLREKQPFVWNATNLSPMVRARQLELFADYNACTRIEFLETPWSEQLRRNAQRKDAVPEQAICHMLEQLVLPEAKEAHQIRWHCV